jgi:hypothetical protein
MTTGALRLSALATSAILIAGISSTALAQKEPEGDAVSAILAWTLAQRLERFPTHEKPGFLAS